MTAGTVPAGTLPPDSDCLIPPAAGPAPDRMVRVIDRSGNVAEQAL